jgi:Xaa-Pro aminopeptidase
MRIQKMSKLQKLRCEMQKLGLDAVIVLDELNQRYLSDFAFTDGLLLITKSTAHLITDFRYYEMAIKSACPDFVSVMPAERKEFIAKLLSENECKTVGLEGGYVSYASYLSYKKNYPDYEFVDIGNMIEILRQIKTPEEILKMQKAQDITDKAFTHILSVINPNMTEIDVAVELEYAMRKNGASACAFDTIAVSGDASALPHGTPRNEKLKSGFLTMDYGAKFDGYCSDMTRTIVIGKANDEIKDVYNTVLKAQLSALEYLAENLENSDCGMADKVARDIIDEKYKGAFGHSLGHSVGLFIHESPRLAAKQEGRKLRVGEVLTVEPGIYLFGKYGCRIEDMVVIEKHKLHNFTASTKELIEIY